MSEKASERREKKNFFQILFLKRQKVPNESQDQSGGPRMVWEGEDRGGTVTPDFIVPPVSTRSIWICFGFHHIHCFPDSDCPSRLFATQDSDSMRKFFLGVLSALILLAALNIGRPSHAAAFFPFLRLSVFIVNSR